MKEVNSEILLIGPGDTLLLTFGKDYDLDDASVIANKIAQEFPDNKIIVNLEGLLTDIKIIKQDCIPFVTGLTTTDSKEPTSWITTSFDSENGYKEFKFNDYIY